MSAFILFYTKRSCCENDRGRKRGVSSFFDLRKDKAKPKEKIIVEAFQMDETPVTNKEYLDFVIRNLSWRKSNISPSLADDKYLSHWQTDYSFKASEREKAVKFVSWFAARAYCRYMGKSLPTIEQWEYVALASEKKKNASSSKEYKEKILSWYSKKG